MMLLFLLATLVVSPNIVVSFSTLPLQRPLGQTFKPLRVTWVSSYETPSTASKSFDSFDYMAHWYPVAWSRDVLLNKPTQVTVFDVNYVIAKIPEGKNGETIVAMEDRCPHKSAFLSEGRVTSTGYLQCAYHGWSFDGKDGTCVEIPQVVTKGGEKPTLTARACGTAVPAMIEQGMVWLFPGGNLEKALQAPLPPTVPEMDMDAFSTCTVVRDFPIDYSILLENILDPDHGLFAHCFRGFDHYSASRDEPQTIEEEFLNNGKGWRISSRVDAVEKLITVDKSRRGKKVKKIDMGKVPVSTSTFTAPNHVVMGRRNKETGETSFITAFWICPTGTGRSRFMSAAIGKMPFSLPRWLMHVSLNNFLDQDTHLLATQQRYVLDVEAEVVGKMSGSDIAMKSTNVRKSTYVYRSPTERLGARLGTFWDETLNRTPNRVSTLLAMGKSGVLKQNPSRRVTLDRESQHLHICPDSLAVVKNCNRVRIASAAVALSLAAFKTYWTVASNVSTGFLSRVAFLLKPSVVKSGLSISLAAWWLAGKLRREFYFKYTEELRDRDLKKIPKIWLEK